MKKSDEERREAGREIIIDTLDNVLSIQNKHIYKHYFKNNLIANIHPNQIKKDIYIKICW